MRSSFRDYMGDMTHHAESTVEQALAHQVGDETSRAYRRGDAFLKRRPVLRDWETYLYGSARKKRRSEERRVGEECGSRGRCGWRAHPPRKTNPQTTQI